MATIAHRTFDAFLNELTSESPSVAWVRVDWQTRYVSQIEPQRIVVVCSYLSGTDIVSFEYFIGNESGVSLEVSKQNENDAESRVTNYMNALIAQGKTVTRGILA